MENSLFWESTIVRLPAQLKEIDATDGQNWHKTASSELPDWTGGGGAHTIEPVWIIKTDKKGNIKGAQEYVDETIGKNWEATDYGKKPQKRK